MNTKTILMAMTCLCAFNSLQGNAQVAGGNTLVATAIEQRRVTLRDSILNHISGAKIAAKSLQIKNFGAKNDGKTDCRAAFAKAIKKASAMKGAKIVVPAGTYYIKGPIVLASNICLELQKGATLKFAPEEKYYPIVNTSWEGTFLYNYSPLIYAYGCKNVSIIGEGTIDGNAMTTFAKWKPHQKKAQQLSRKMNHEEVPVSERKFGDGYWLRPQLVQLYNCQGITLEGVKITNSPFWCIHLLKSENIICRNLRYDAKLINNDGLDPECSRNILIEGIAFNNGDDNVAIKSGRDNDGWNAKMPSENIIIRNCHFARWAITIGSEMSGGVRNIYIEDCKIDSCRNGIYFKSNLDRGGYFENLNMRRIEADVCLWGVINFRTNYHGYRGGNHPTLFRNICIEDVTCNRVDSVALMANGLPEAKLYDITLRNITVKKAPKAIQMENVVNLTLDNVTVNGKAVTAP